MRKMGKALKEALKEETTHHVRTTKRTSGYMIRHFRELNGLSQTALGELTGLAQSTISALEKDRESLGNDRAKVLARALHVHPAVLAFPDWDVTESEGVA